MTARILKSLVEQFDDFAAQAAAHAVEMKNWRAHMARVKVDEANPKVDPAEKHWPIRRPDPHPLIESAVNENDEMDYEVVDDSPTANEILRAKKNKLIDLVSATEQAAIETIIPRGRARLYGMRERKIRERDAGITAELLGPPSIGKTLKNAVGLGPKAADIASEVARVRPPADHLHLQEQEQRRAAIEEIRQKAAIAHDAIEDLTIENVDGFKIPDFTAKD